MTQGTRGYALTDDDLTERGADRCVQGCSGQSPNPEAAPCDRICLQHSTRTCSLRCHHRGTDRVAGAERGKWRGRIRWKLHSLMLQLQDRGIGEVEVGTVSSESMGGEAGEGTHLRSGLCSSIAWSGCDSVRREETTWERQIGRDSSAAAPPSPVAG